MAKKVKFRTGDIFSIEAAENEYVFGRVVFDPQEQYTKKVPQKEQFSYLDFFSRCVLIETYLGVASSLENIDINKVAFKSRFVSSDIFQRGDVKILNNILVNPKNASFPEVISTFNSKYYFTVGELKLPININSQEYDEIHVFPAYGSGYWELVVTLMYSERKDLVEEEDIKEDYSHLNDIRDRHEVRKKIYTILGEDPNQSYYELALKHSFDLARLY